VAIHLSVNLNKIALLRNSREGNFPNVLAFGRRCLELGAHGLTIHPRPDQRHIRASDIQSLSVLVSEFPGREFNMEGNPFSPAQGDYPGFLQLVEHARPHQCTLVPDSNHQLTSDHGFDLYNDGDRLRPILEQLRKHNIRSSLFMDPISEQIHQAKAVGADRIELYTGPYAAAYLQQTPTLESLFKEFYRAAKLATDSGLGVNAGHDLNLVNLPRFCSIPGLLEVSIGHALTVDALSMGWDETVKAYLAVCQSSITNPA
jgi:pyridoxine 5-phosphate synthase